MSSRDVVLGRIREALADRPAAELPPPAEVWPATGAATEALVERFARELGLLEGELHRCRSIDEARATLGELVAPLTGPPDGAVLGAIDRPDLRELAAGLPAGRIAWVADEGDPRQMAGLGAGLVAAEVLLADTGSCVVAAATAAERLMCYLVPICIVLARVDQLREHLPAAWGELAEKLSDPQRRGELVVLTGPSRTSDIEKILILGVHGPKRLVVLLVE